MRIPYGGEKPGVFLPELFLFFTVDYSGKKTKAEHNVAAPEKRRACLHERGLFFRRNSRGCARDAIGTQGRIESFLFFRGVGMFT